MLRKESVAGRRGWHWVVQSCAQSVIHVTPALVIGRKYASWYAPERRKDLSRLNDEDIATFKKILNQEDEPVQGIDGVIGGKGGVVTEADTLETMNIDWMKKFKGNSTVALFPKTARQVADILKYCNQRKIGVVPQGGNTGLVGGSVAVYDEIILSTAKMNKIISFDQVSGVLACQSGCVLQVLDQFLEQKGHIMPLDLGAKGSCQIGGNVSTNAGGIRLLRYGSLKGSVMGLEVALADGSILNTMNAMRKDNTGYDLKQLFIGAEGTLGIVTGVSLMAPPRPKSCNVALVAVSSFKDVQNTFVRAKRDLGEILSAFEFFDEESLRFELAQLNHLRNPLSGVYPFHVLIETSGSNEAHDTEKLSSFLEAAMADEVVKDGVISQDGTQFKQIWALRESITESLSKAGPVYKYDLSIPISRMYDLVEETRARIGNRGRVLGYGHVGDSNLHLNVSVPAYTEEVLSIIEPFVYEWTSKLGGSISAEHGLGLMKRNHLHYSKGESAIQYMAAIKKMFDPNGILNPYKVIPDSAV